MVTCNLCRKNKKVNEMEIPFKYVCSECWKKLIIKLNGEIVDKDLIY